MVPLTDKIASQLLPDIPKHIKEIAENFVWIPESTIRWRLNENVWTLFERVGKWLYVLSWDKSTVGLINGDARILDDKFEKNSTDLILSDHAWLDEKSHKGWNRSFANYECFKYEQSDFDQKAKVLKEWGFLVEFLPERNENNRKYLREIEDMAEKAGFKYFAEVNISWGNSNIGRKKKFVSTCYFFTKWEARKLKIWDEKLAKDIRNWRFQFLIDEHRIDFKKVYSEVLHVEDKQVWEDFIRHVNENKLPEFIEYNKLLDRMRAFYNKEKEWGVLSEDEKIEYEELKGQEEAFYAKHHAIETENINPKKWKYEYMKDRYRSDFQEVYQEILNSKTWEEADLESICQKNIELWILPQFKKIKWELVTMLRLQSRFNHHLDNDTNDDNSQIIESLSYKIQEKESIIENFKKAFSEYVFSLETQDNNVNLKLRENFLKHLKNWELPQFRKAKKVEERLEELTRLTLTDVQQEEYDNLRLQSTAFYKAFDEYIDFLQQADSYKMGTKTILPEIYMWDLSEIREESQKPKNVLEDIILQTTREGDYIIEQFARSYIWAEAVIGIWENGQWWRNYFWIELDKEVFDRSTTYLKEQYKDFKFLTYDDFFKQMPETTIDYINSTEANKNFKIIQASVEHINNDLSDVIEIQLKSYFNVSDGNEITADNIQLPDRTMLMEFNMKRSKTDANKNCQSY